MAMDVEVIWVKRKPEYFCKKGWTGGSAICPSGKRLRLIGTPAEDLLIEPQQPHHEDRCSETWEPPRTGAGTPQAIPGPRQTNAPRATRRDLRLTLCRTPQLHTRMIELDVCS
jgi:hypothetical protein